MVFLRNQRLGKYTGVSFIGAEGLSKGSGIGAVNGILEVDAATQEQGRKIQVLQCLEAQRNPKTSHTS